MGAQTLLGLQNDDGSWGRYPATDEEWGDAAAYHSAPLGGQQLAKRGASGGVVCVVVMTLCVGGNVDGNTRTID